MEKESGKNCDKINYCQKQQQEQFYGQLCHTYTLSLSHSLTLSLSHTLTLTHVLTFFYPFPFNLVSSYCAHKSSKLL